MLEEIHFLIKESVVKEEHKDNRKGECELQPLKWIHAIKTTPTNDPPLRFRSRLVSASHATELRHAVVGNAPTISLSTLRELMAIAPTWNRELKANKDSLAIISRDVTKA